MLSLALSTEENYQRHTRKIAKDNMSNVRKGQVYCYYCAFSGVFYCILEEGIIMAKNAPIGDGQRRGMVRGRSQVYNSKVKKWVKRNSETGQFMDMKSDSKKFKGVRKEKG